MTEPPTMRTRLSFLTLHVVLPIIAGGLVYICWRDPALLMFKWFRVLGVEPHILQLRLITVSARPSLPYWFVYSLPDGLWVYALTAFMAHVWSGSPASVIKTGWLSLGLLLGAGSELGQLAGIVPGSFDWTDFVFYVVAAAIPFLAASRSNFRRSINEQSTKEGFAFTNGTGNLPAVGLRQ